LIASCCATFVFDGGLIISAFSGSLGAHLGNRYAQLIKYVAIYSQQQPNGEDDLNLELIGDKYSGLHVVYLGA
jgi:hypothetical protein